ncbi:pentatricopeptide repeat-containing protein At2g20710, mitochondrial-like [Actinidia eriantha]|uniref:pentatricopeptide repeat-containing protein At2g20710, mitochondrial-like n=1 Tax=Actinidia eriantha TaxID=165200 RepID=UPI002585E55C|nr:pentatricopeptide repeat-containing protein At2g20710, mitochondrial-like [Actinidia eriantha]
MSRRWNLDPSPGDIAGQLDLVLNDQGRKRAEKYFSNIPDSLRTFHVYRALLICYAEEKSLGKAEAILQKMREFGICVGHEWNGEALTQREDKSEFSMDWNAYIITANGYLKAGLAKKGLEMPMKSKQRKDDRRRGFAYEMLLMLYASLGNIDELHCIWNL